VWDTLDVTVRSLVVLCVKSALIAASRLNFQIALLIFVISGLDTLAVIVRSPKALSVVIIVAVSVFNYFNYLFIL
jgi:hypothetical protein